MREGLKAEQGQFQAGWIPNLHSPNGPRFCTCKLGKLRNTAPQWPGWSRENSVLRQMWKRNKRQARRPSSWPFPAPTSWGKDPIGHHHKQKKKNPNFNPWKSSILGREEGLSAYKVLPKRAPRPPDQSSQQWGPPAKASGCTGASGQLSSPQPAAGLLLLLFALVLAHLLGAGSPASSPPPAPGDTRAFVLPATWARLSQPPPLAAPPQPSQDRLAGGGGRGRGALHFSHFRCGLERNSEGGTPGGLHTQRNACSHPRIGQPGLPARSWGGGPGKPGRCAALRAVGKSKEARRRR